MQALSCDTRHAHSCTEIAVQQDAQGFTENQEAARSGGNIAGNARKELEQKSGRKVVSKSNFLNPAIEKERTTLLTDDS